MFAKVNAKQEQFLLLVLEGMPAMRAYAQIYDPSMAMTVAATCASKLLTKTNVRARQGELIAARQARRPISLEFLTDELVDINQRAKAANQLSAASVAVMGIAKLHGLIVDRVQSDVLVRKPSSDPNSADEMSPEQWLGTFAPMVIEHNSTPMDSTPSETTVIEHNNNEEANALDCTAMDDTVIKHNDDDT